MHKFICESDFLLEDSLIIEVLSFANFSSLAFCRSIWPDTNNQVFHNKVDSSSNVAVKAQTKAIPWVVAQNEFWGIIDFDLWRKWRECCGANFI